MTEPPNAPKAPPKVPPRAPRATPAADPRREREAKLAEALRANLRRRKSAGPAKSSKAED